jgi:TatA/E family protein of Tat protein translocase
LFGIGGWEFLLIAVLALLLFGPDKLPQFARTIGRVVRDFKRYQDLMESTIRAEIYATEPTETPDAFKKGKEFRERVQGGEFDASEEAEGTGEQQESEESGEQQESEETGEPQESAGDSDASADVDATEADGEVAGSVRTGLPADHPLHDAFEAGEDIGIDDDLDLASIDSADLGWVPGRDAHGEGADTDEA